MWRRVGARSQVARRHVLGEDWRWQDSKRIRLALRFQTAPSKLGPNPGKRGIAAVGVRGDRLRLGAGNRRADQTIVAPSPIKPDSAVRGVARWALLSTALNPAWEIAQLPLYTLYRTSGPTTIAYDIAHCTAGDALIALSSYGVAVLATRRPRWPVERPALGAAAAIATGLTYSAVSEWLNVLMWGSWAYAPTMPTIYGIGLSPLLQWLAVPIVTLFAVRSWGKP